MEHLETLQKQQSVVSPAAPRGRRHCPCCAAGSAGARPSEAAAGPRGSCSLRAASCPSEGCAQTPWALEGARRGEAPGGCHLSSPSGRWTWPGGQGLASSFAAGLVLLVRGPLPIPADLSLPSLASFGVRRRRGTGSSRRTSTAGCRADSLRSRHPGPRDCHRLRRGGMCVTCLA